MDAATLTLELDVVFSGNDPASATTPWASATFEDTGLNMVQLTMSTDNLTGTEFLSQWYFNLDPNLSPGDLSFSYDSGQVLDNNSHPNAKTTAPGGGPGGCTVNCFKADGDGYFDILFDFPPPGTTRFTNGMTSVWDITYGGSGSFDVYSFLFGSVNGVPGAGNYYSAAHIQGISPNCSGWIGDGVLNGSGGSDGPCGGTGPGTGTTTGVPTTTTTTGVPEPTTLLLLGLGVGLGAQRMQRRRRAQ